jgi:ABC-type transport system involved in multi-copper enzyme maturation permease subunit
MQEKNPKISMSKYLGRRLFLSLAILFIILFSISLGFLTPNPKPY